MGKLVMSLALAVALAGCLGSEQAPEPQLSAPAGSVKPVLAGALTGVLGQGLDARDVGAAFEAQLAALDAGQRRSWSGAKKGVFGYVEAGPETGGCRSYSHTIYVAGRPRLGGGSACRDAATGWRIAA